jgi:hypothetical protein
MSYWLAFNFASPMPWPLLWPYLVPPLVIGAAVRTYNFFEGERLARDLWREYRLAHADIAALDRAWAARADRSDIIVSLTTIPSRIGLIADTLKSLLTQTRPPKEIRLNLPAFSRRENRPYAVPDWLASLASVRIAPCEDYGPATKLLPTLADAAPGQAILVVDDDRIYPVSLIADLEKASAARPGAALGLGGWIAPADLIDRPTTILSNLLMRPPAPVRSARIRKPVAVDILQGVAGYLVRPDFFNLAALTDYSAAPPAARTVDDVWISAHCRADKFVIPAAPNFPPKRHLAQYKRSSLGWINRGAGGDENRNNSIMLKYFAAAWKVGGPRARTHPVHV